MFLVPPTRRHLLASACTLPTATLLAGCYAPRPEKLELTVPVAAHSAVTATVTLVELPSEEQSFESTYTIEPGGRIVAGEFAEGVDYRATVAIDDTVRWRETVRANQFYALELHPDGSVTVVESGAYESTPAPTDG